MTEQKASTIFKGKSGKIIAITIAAVLLCAIIAGTAVGIFYGSTAIVSASSFVEEDNLARGAEYFTPEGKKTSSLALKGNSASEKTVKLKQAEKINTIVLYESGIRVNGFEIWADGVLVDKQEEIGTMRYCAIDTVTTDNFIIKITDCFGSYNVTKFEAYYIERDENFRITSYLTAESIKNADFTWDNIASCTDIIIFGDAYYYIDGSITYDEQLLTSIKQNIKSAANGKPINIYLNFLIKTPPSEEVPEAMRPWEKVIGWGHNKAMGDNKQKLLSNLISCVKSLGFDGIDLDYEYPRTSKEWKIYGDFLVALKEKAPDLMLSSALQIWNMNLSKAALDALDVIQVMGYDGSDQYGNHSGFAQCARQPLEYYKRLGVDLKKVNMGAPFYGRPITMERYWSDYKTEITASEDELARFKNFTEIPLTVYWNNDEGLYLLPPEGYTGETKTIGKRSFNSVQMIRDKTAFLYDVGAGGIMIWHYSAGDMQPDHPLSLFGAITAVLQNR